MRSLDPEDIADALVSDTKQYRKGAGKKT